MRLGKMRNSSWWICKLVMTNFKNSLMNLAKRLVSKKTRLQNSLHKFHGHATCWLIAFWGEPWMHSPAFTSFTSSIWGVWSLWNLREGRKLHANSFCINHLQARETCEGWFATFVWKNVLKEYICFTRWTIFIEFCFAYWTNFMIIIDFLNVFWMLLIMTDFYTLMAELSTLRNFDRNGMMEHSLLRI